MDAVSPGQRVHIGGDAFVDLIPFGTIIHIDDVCLGQGAHDGLQLVVGQGVQPLLCDEGRAQGLVKELGIGDAPENVAVHGHILLVGGQHLGRGNIIQLGGLAEIFHAVDEGDLEVESRLIGGGDDLGEPDGAGVFIFPHSKQRV